MRPDAAHAELLAADPRPATVTDIAGRRGLGHPVAALYRDAHRTSPSTTLNRSANRSA